jgi:hypothetical protein
VVHVLPPWAATLTPGCPPPRGDPERPLPAPGVTAAILKGIRVPFQGRCGSTARCIYCAGLAKSKENTQTKQKALFHLDTLRCWVNQRAGLDTAVAYQASFDEAAMKDLAKWLETRPGLRKDLSHLGAIPLSVAGASLLARAGHLRTVYVELRAVKAKTTAASTTSPSAPCQIQARLGHDFGNQCYWMTYRKHFGEPPLNVEHTADIIEALLGLPVLAEAARESRFRATDFPVKDLLPKIHELRLRVFEVIEKWDQEYAASAATITIDDLPLYYEAEDGTICAAGPLLDTPAPPASLPSARGPAAAVSPKKKEESSDDEVEVMSATATPQLAQPVGIPSLRPEGQRRPTARRSLPGQAVVPDEGSQPQAKKRKGASCPA